MLPVKVAIACPEREGELWATVEDPEFSADGRPCAFAGPCASVAELREALASGNADVVLVSATLNAIAFETLRELSTGHRLVVLAADAMAEQWAELQVPVLGVDPSRDELAEAIEQAMTCRGMLRRGTPLRRRSLDTPTSRVPTADAATPACDVIAVAKPYRGDGVTLVAASLAFATGVFEPRTVLIDVNFRAGSVEFQLGVNPARNAAQLVRRAEDAQYGEVAWDAVLQGELQSMGPPSHGQVLCGITKLSQRTQLSDRSIKQLLQALKERYRYIFLATSGSGWTLDDPDLDQLVLHLSDRILLVVRPDIEGLTLAMRALQEWPQREKVHVVLNEIGLPDQVSRRDVEAKLQVPVAAVLPFDPWKVASARARNRPVVCERGSRLARPLMDLAGRIVGGRIELPPDEPVQVSPWWQRLPLAVAGVIR